jgi:hypothetical protein
MRQKSPHSSIVHTTATIRVAMHKSYEREAMLTILFYNFFNFYTLQRVSYKAIFNIFDAGKVGAVLNWDGLG